MKNYFLIMESNKVALDFTLPDQTGKLHSLADYSGQTVLLYFYPKDDTPGCTVEACNLRDSLNELKKAGIQVLGVSLDSVESHKKFAEKFHLNFPLLADVDKTVVQAYGVWKEKSMPGKKYMGIQRDSFLIKVPQLSSPPFRGLGGMIIKHFEKVDPKTHVEEVLSWYNERI